MRNDARYSMNEIQFAVNSMGSALRMQPGSVCAILADIG